MNRFPLLSMPLRIKPVWFFLSLCICFCSSPLSAEVAPDGSFRHSIPIELPAGVNGVVPKLALAYSSNGGNGMLGIGWRLSGLPSITRMN